MDQTDIAIKGPLDTARTNVEQAFTKYDFWTEWYSQLEGRARRGKLGLNLTFGYISPYCEIDIHLLTQTDGSIILRLIRSRVGMKGGIPGPILADREFSEAVAGIANYFTYHV